MKVAMLNTRTSAAGNYDTSFDKIFGDNLELILDLIPEHDIVIGAEWLFLPRDRLHTLQEKDTLVQILCNATKDQKRLILPGTIFWHNGHEAYNTCPIIADGELVDEYHKYYDGGDEDIVLNANLRQQEINLDLLNFLKNGRRQKLTFCPGDSKGSHFQWQGLDIGVVICADHNLLYERHHFERKKTKVPLLNLHFLLACGLYLSHTNLITKVNGYSLGLNGYSEYGNEVWQIKSYKNDCAKIKLIEPTQTLTSASIYEIEI